MVILCHEEMTSLIYSHQTCYQLPGMIYYLLIYVLVLHVCDSWNESGCDSCWHPISVISTTMRRCDGYSLGVERTNLSSAQKEPRLMFMWLICTSQRRNIFIYPKMACLLVEGIFISPHIDSNSWPCIVQQHSNIQEMGIWDYFIQVTQYQRAVMLPVGCWLHKSMKQL